MKLKSILILCAVLAVAGVVYFISSRPKPVPPAEGIHYIWDLNMNALTDIEIILPKQSDTVESPNHQAWVLHDDRYYYFDVPNGTKVDMQRWGGGIPLLLSGPGAARKIAENVPDTALVTYGFTSPNIVINLKLNDNAEYHILVGDSTPSGGDYYIKMQEEPIVYTVDKSWYGVISGLVTNPPYQPAVYAVQEFNYIPAQPSAGQPFVIHAVIKNTGVLETPAADIVLKVQGDLVETKTVQFAGDTIQTFDFNVAAQPAGTYSINLGGKTAKLVIP